MEFETFLARNGIKHITSAPYHPATNWLTERAIQTFKTAIKKTDPSIPIEIAVSCFLFTYRLTPHSTTGISPAEVLLGRRPSFHLDQLHPNLAGRVRKKQEHQKNTHDQRVKNRAFKVGDTVLVRNFTSGPLWLPGSVVGLRGTLTYDVKLDDSRGMRRHIDHLRSRLPSVVDDPTDPTTPPSEINSEWDADDTTVIPPVVPTANATDSLAQPPPEPALRRSARSTGTVWNLNCS